MSLKKLGADRGLSGLWGDECYRRADVWLLGLSLILLSLCSLQYRRIGIHHARMK